MFNLANHMTDKYNICAGRAGILSLISQREQGFLSNSQYKSNATNIKVNQLPKISDCTSVFTDFDDGYYWHFLRSGLRGDIIAVCWNCNGALRRRHSAVCVCRFTYSLLGEKDASISATPFIKEITKTYQILQNMLIIDTADLSYRNQKPLLIVGDVKGKGSVAILTSYHCDYVHQEYEWRVDGSIYCCASEINSENFALGCFNGFYVCKDLRLSKKYHLPDHVIAADFNNDGNLLFISCSRNGIQLCDMRENIDSSRRNLPPYIKERALDDSTVVANKMKLLADQVTLIVSDEKGRINKVDLRMRKCVFQYPDHRSLNYKRPLNIDEDLDLLCAVGNDSCCRIWSLSSGKLNWANKISSSSSAEEPLAPHACIVSSERRWFVAVVRNDTVIPIVPDEAEVVTSQPDGIWSSASQHMD